MAEYTKEERVTKREDVIRKIRACLARAKSDSGSSPNEMAIAARQAELLMRKYNLEMEEVIREEILNPENITWAYVRTNMFKKNKAIIKEVQEWPQWIAVRCGELYDCHASIRYVEGEGQVIAFFGYKIDMDVCVWTYDYLLDRCREASLKIQDHEAIGSGLRIGKYRETFREGMAHELCDRLRDIVTERRKSMGSGSGTSLVVSKRAAVEAKFGNFNYGHCKKDVDTNSEAYERGQEEGRKVSITPNPITHKPAATSGQLTHKKGR